MRPFMTWVSFIPFCQMLVKIFMHTVTILFFDGFD